MTNAEAALQIRDDTSHFLLRNSFTPSSAGSVAGFHTFYMLDAQTQIERPGAMMGNKRKQQGQRFRANPNLLMGGGGAPFNAVHIPVQPSNVAINPLPLPLVGARIMITTQLTGCCIVMVPGAGTWSVAHLQPTGETGVQLQQRLKKSGLKTYGAADYAGGRAALVGVRTNRNWRFYAQRQDRHFNVLNVKQL